MHVNDKYVLAWNYNKKSITIFTVMTNNNIYFIY